MKYAIISDVHSNLEAFQAVLRKCREKNLKNFLFLGDVIGYGPNPSECVDLLHDLKCVAIVKGNHDDMMEERNGEMFDFSKNAKAAIEFTKKKLKTSQKKWLESLPLTANVEDFIIAHACLYVPECWFYLIHDAMALSLTYTAMAKEKKKLCFIGHSHYPVVFYKKNDSASTILPTKIPDDFVIINTGSVGQPRDSDPRAFLLIYDSETKELEIERVPYDVSKTAKKIRDYKLPDFLADRLFKGI